MLQRTFWPALGSRRGIAFNPDVLGKIESLIGVMQEIGSRHHASTAQIATAWSIAKGTVPIIGVTKTSHIEDAIKASEIALTTSEILELEKAAHKTGVRIKGDWEKSMV